MHRLLVAQLKKSHGISYDLDEMTPEVQKLLELVEESYKDNDRELDLLEHVLETNSNELTAANRSLSNSHDLLKSVTESIADIIFYKDMRSHYIGCNKRFSELTGVPAKEIIGKSDHDIFDKKHADHFRSMDKAMFESSEPQLHREWVTYPDGHNAYFLTLRSPLLNSQGELLGLVGISHDITKEHEMTEELKAKNNMLIQQSRFAAMGEMIGNIAHQWRQPLNALGLLLQNIEIAYQHELLDDAYLDRSIKKGTRLTVQMSQTIDDFRNFFRPNKIAEMFNIHDTVQNAIALIRPSFVHDEIDITFTGDQTVQTMGFPSEFSQVILNLLNNAKDEFVERDIAHKKIFIRLFQEKEAVHIEIEDNAGGIPDEIIDKVFDPYFSTKEEGKGTGIGLYMSKTIIENNMKGRLIVTNTSQGACFSIILS